MNLRKFFRGRGAGRWLGAGLLTWFLSCGVVDAVPAHDCYAVRSETDAVQVLFAQAGMHEIRDGLLRLSGGTVHLIVIDEGAEPAVFPPRWDFYVGENHEDHTSVIAHAYVDACGQVFSWDFAKDGYVPWREWWDGEAAAWKVP